MKMVYTNENRLITGNASNILENHGIKIVLKNEFSSSASGEISAFDTWPEIWVVKDSDYEKAVKIIENSLSRDSEPEWLCTHCAEKNDASFELCWNCQNLPPKPST